MCVNKAKKNRHHSNLIFKRIYAELNFNVMANLQQKTTPEVEKKKKTKLKKK